MLLGAVADDFTGASDLANTLAKGGMSTVQFSGPGQIASNCEAGVVSLKTRSIRVADAVRQSLEAARWLLDQGCEQIIFKYCSTFDSAPQGNIGPVAEALLDLLGADVAVVCPAFPGAGRRIFMGHLFVGDRLLSESGMQNHPLTPMTDPDIRRWLRLQTKGEVGGISLDGVRCGTDALRTLFGDEARAGRRLVVTDAVDDSDLMTIGAAVAGHKLVTGGSGIAQGLPANFRARGKLSGKSPELPLARGRGVVLCGSCSTASQAQVANYRAANPSLMIDPGELMRGEITVELAAKWIATQHGATPIVYSTAEPKSVADAQTRFGREVVAARIETFFATLARRLADTGTRRFVVGGGETSGAIVEALALSSMQVGPEIDPGVPVLVSDRGGPIGLALKSGNFGAPDFFTKALTKVGRP
jgi:3-dehydrotetronate 4-kinase